MRQTCSLAPTKLVTPDKLFRIVEDARARPTVRAAAAVALASSGLDEEGRARVRVAAEATAAPKLRVALEAATSDDEEELTAALRELEEGEAA